MVTEELGIVVVKELSTTLTDTSLTLISDTFTDAKLI